MKTKLLNVLGVGLLMAAIAPLWAQNVEIESEVYVDEASGDWYAAGYTKILNDPACDYCGESLSVTTTAKEDGQDITTVSGSGTMDYASDEYDSPTIVNLGSRYEAYSRHDWIDAFGASNENYTDSYVDVPGIPNISLNNIDASDPSSVKFNYVTHPNGFQSLYSSTVTIGNLNAISDSKENPQFAFDQNQYPPNYCCGPVTTSIEFQGYLAGHFFPGPTYSVTVWVGRTVSDYHTGSVPEGTEITGGTPTVMSVTHTTTENFNSVTYGDWLLLTGVPEYVDHLNSAHATMDTHSNPCAPSGPPECDIAGIGEVNRWPYPPYPAANNDPMPRVPIALPPGYTDSNTLWAMEADYYGLWLQEGTGFAVCNTLFSIRAYGGSFAPLAPMGCISLTLP